METSIYEHLRRVETNDKGIERLSMKQQRFARLISLLIQFSVVNGFQITFGDAWAKSGHMKGSLHYSRLAFDLNLFKDGVYLTDGKDYKIIGEYWESLGGFWGGRFGDGNHFSLEYLGRN